jgi:chaperonin GroES
MKIKPLGDRLLVKILKTETTSGGILLPDKFQLISSLGEVVATGPGYLSDEKTEDKKDKWDPTFSKVGDKIFFFKQSGVALSEKYRLLHDKDVLARIDDENGFEIGDLSRDNQ